MSLFPVLSDLRKFASVLARPVSNKQVGAGPARLRPLRILILNQAFYPDVVSTAQHASDLAAALAERGHQVTVVASSRCYDNPRVGFAARETWKGVQIRRIWSSGFGKGAKWKRAADFGSYIVSCVGRLIWMPRQDVVVALTTPPLISFIAALLVRLKGGHLVFWVMDLNPDEAIAAGWLKASSPITQILQGLLLYSLHTAHRLIALDRFMADRLTAKGAERDKVVVLPPWSHNSEVFFDATGRARFREEHGLKDKFVVMYSGNHSPCHPLSTLLEAARSMSDHKDVMFVFVGGGSEWKTVRRFSEEHNLRNVLTLPYQPLDVLSSSLSAADLHAVVMGDPYVGMVHPCKIYNVLSLGTPVLYIGPEHSHISDLAAGQRSGPWLYASQHGESSRVAGNICEARSRWLLQINDEKRVATKFSQDALLGPHIETIESSGRSSRFTQFAAPEPNRTKELA